MSENMEQVELATKRNVIVESRVIAEFDLSWVDKMTFDRERQGFRPATPEEIGEMLREKCSDFHDFLRDHRSQDAVQLTVETVRKDVCSQCDDDWETYIEDDPDSEDFGNELCACCGALVKLDARKEGAK